MAIPSLKRAYPITLLLIWLPFALLAADDDMGPSAAVTSLHQRLLQSMQAAAQWDQQQRYAKLAPVIEAVFDNKYITRIVLGRYWQGLSEARQLQFTTLLTQLNIATYAARFKQYDNESFTFVETKELRNGRTLVKTKIEHGDGQQAVALDYILDKSTDQWKIIGVVANGINELSLKRAEYTRVLREEGEEQLIKKITEKIDALANPS